MTFEHDFLISYAHIDDQALAAGENGWVSQLHRLLEIRVGQLLGQTPRVWRDLKLQGNDFFSDTILERLPRIAALVSVFSPRYVQSEWCNRELTEFWRAAQSSGGVRVAEKARIFKVVKTPVPLERQPEQVQPMLGYEFFIYDERGRPRELPQDNDPGHDRAFLTRLDDLAYDIVQLLELLKSNGGAKAVPQGSKEVVYLAETSHDLREERETIKRDLIRNGFEVLPDRPLPLVSGDFDAMVREQLKRSKLSIHLIGHNYGVIPEGASRSVIERQQELAAEIAPASGLSSLIWVAPGGEIEDARQARFLRHIDIDAEVHATAEVLATPLEDLKTLIHRKLTPPPAAAPKSALPPSQELTRVYLVCDPQDVEAARPLEDYLFGQGFEVTLPIFDLDEAEARLEHEESLRSCDVILFYYGATSELWLRRKLRELQKSAALGRDKPWLGRAIYVGAPATPQKERFRTLEATLIQEPAAGFDRSALDPFLSEIAKAREAVGS
jgi:hypothetical protein